MKQPHILSTIVMLWVLCCTPTLADDLQLTLDLRNNISNDATSGGIWELYARKLETGSGAEGDFGIGAIRGLLKNIDVDSIEFAPAIGQPTTGGPFIQTLSNGTVEINYEQDLSGTVMTGVGVYSPPTRDSLIASGTWPSGPRPIFDLDPQGMASSGSFLSSASAPFSLVSPDNIYSEVVTLGDMNDTNTVTLLDVALHAAQLPGNGALSYDPAADINQSGSVSNIDRGLFFNLLANRNPSLLTPAPSPSGNEAGRVFFSGDIGPTAIGETGTLEICMDLDTSDSFINGGVELGVRLGPPGVIKFTTANFVGGFWPFSSAEANDHSVHFSTVSYITGGLSQGAQGQLFATIDYERIGPGSTEVFFEIGPETLVNGPNFPPTSEDVTQNYAFIPNAIGAQPGDFDNDGDVDGADFLTWQRDPSVGSLAAWQANYGSSLTGTLDGLQTVPEPSTMSLTGLTLISLVLLRRQGQPASAQ